MGVERDHAGGHLRQHRGIDGIGDQRLIDDEAQQVHAVEVEQVADGTGPGAIVEDAGAAANDGLAAGRWSIGKAEARREVVGIVVEVVLPVVADSEVERKIRLQADVVLDESGDDFFQKNYVALAGLQEVSGGCGGGEIGAAGEGVSAGAVGEIVEAAAADVGNIDAEAELMLAVGVGGEVGSVEVIFGAAGIGLRAAGGEESRDRELGSAADAADGIVKVADEKPQLVQPVRRKLVKIADVDFVFEKVGVGAGAGKSGAADVLIFDGAMFVGVADPELVAVGEVVEDAS